MIVERRMSQSAHRENDALEMSSALQFATCVHAFNHMHAPNRSFTYHSDGAIRHGIQ